MGTLVKNWKTIPMPAGAKVKRDGTVMWTVKGKKREGNLSGADRVSMQVDMWTAQYTDETGTVQRVSTKTKDQSVALKILARYEAEVDRIRSGVVTREELNNAQTRNVTLNDAFERFRTKMVAGGCTPEHVTKTMRRVSRFCQETGIDSVPKIRREAIERWVANEIQKKILTPASVNHYLTALKMFVQYLVDVEILPSNPLKSIRKLNQELGQRKKRRAMTAEEVERLLKAATTMKRRKGKKAEEQVLIYKLLLGTGLRSTELSLLTPNQVDFKHNRLTIEAAKTKNRTADVLPIREDLVQSVKEWVETHGIQGHERIFRYNRDSIRRSFYRDLKAAGIERVGKDGRSIDVHSFRKTFGTMLARAGIPLTTVQRLMRHSTPLLTAKLYIDVDPVDMTQALSALPTF